MSLWSLLPAAIQLGSMLFKKPKRKDYMPNTEGIQRYINSLKGRRANREVEAAMLRPAMRIAGAQDRRLKREQEAYVSKSGLKGSGIEAQLDISRSQQYNNVLQQAAESAGLAQAQENTRLTDAIDKNMSAIEQANAQGLQEYSRAKTEWNQNLGAAGLNLAGAGIAEIGASHEALKTAFESAKAAGLFDGDMNEFSDLANKEGLSPSYYGQYLATQATANNKIQTEMSSLIESNLLPPDTNINDFRSIYTQVGGLSQLKSILETNQVATAASLSGEDINVLSDKLQAREINPTQFTALVKEYKESNDNNLTQPVKSAIDAFIGNNPQAIAAALGKADTKDDLSRIINLFKASESTSKAGGYKFYKIGENSVIKINPSTDEVTTVYTGENMTPKDRRVFDTVKNSYNKFVDMSITQYGTIKLSPRNETAFIRAVEKIIELTDNQLTYEDLIYPDMISDSAYNRLVMGKSKVPWKQ